VSRQTKLTPEIQKKIVDDLTAGVPRTTAAARAGIHYSSFNLWMKKKGKPYSAFSDAVKKAEADAIARAVATIIVAGRKTWQAHAWWLERKWPEEWSNNRMEMAILKRDILELKRQVHNGKSGR
jgi:hypothetical protein